MCIIELGTTDVLYQFKRRPGEPPGKCMLSKRKRSRIEKRVEWLWNAWADLAREAKDQRFPPTTPLMQDLAKIRVYLVSLVDHLNTSCQMRDDHLKRRESVEVPSDE